MTLHGLRSYLVIAFTTEVIVMMIIIMHTLSLLYVRPVCVYIRVS